MRYKSVKVIEFENTTTCNSFCPVCVRFQSDENDALYLNPLVDFKKPLEVIPKIIANNKKVYPDKFVIYYPVLPSRFTINTPEIIKIKPTIV